MTWNSEENLQRLRSCITALKLPPPPPAAEDGEIRILFLLTFVSFVKNEFIWWICLENLFEYRRNSLFESLPRLTVKPSEAYPSRLQ